MGVLIVAKVDCSCALVRYRDAHDLGALVSKASNLLHRRLCIGGISIRHRLHDDGSITADLHVTNVDGAGLAS